MSKKNKDRRASRQAAWDELRIQLVIPGPEASFSRSQVNNFAPELFGSFIDLLANGMGYSDQRFERSTRVLCGAIDGLMNPMPLFDHLGEIVILKRGAVEQPVRLPTPEMVIPAAEEWRAANLLVLKESCGGDPEKMVDVLLSHGHSPAPNGRDPKQTTFTYLPRTIAAASLMTAYLRQKYDRPVEQPLGWTLGRLVETRIMLSKAPAMRLWSSDSRFWFEYFFNAVAANLEDFGGFALPTPSESTGHGTAGSADQTPVPNEDPSRIAYFIGLIPFVEIRSLDGRNPYSYSAIVFTENRLGIDTVRRGNRFFGLSGGLGLCLTVGQNFKQEIKDSALCQTHFPHDRHGAWKRKVRTWLKC